jgi:chromosome partitioning protein
VEGVELFVLDTAPQIPPVDMIRQADLVVIPVRPSPNDLRAVGATLQVVEAANKPFCFVINAIKYNTRIATNTLHVLAQHGRVAPVMIGDSVNLSESMITGQVASEYAPGCKSATEIAELWIYVHTLLNK